MISNSVMKKKNVFENIHQNNDFVIEKWDCNSDCARSYGRLKRVTVLKLRGS